MNNQELVSRFQNHPDVLHVEVHGDGCHCELTVVSEVFSGQSKLARQKWVYRIVKEKLLEGSLHALNMKTLTPEEWRASHG